MEKRFQGKMISTDSYTRLSVGEKGHDITVLGPDGAAWKMKVLLFFGFVAAVAYIWLLIAFPLVTLIELPFQSSWLRVFDQDWVPAELFTGSSDLRWG